MRKFTYWLFCSKRHNFGLLVLRVAAGTMIFTHGYAKIQNFSALRETFADPIGIGVVPSLLLIIFAEACCSVALVIGLLTRLAAIPIIIGMFVAAFLVSPEFDFNASEQPLTYLLMALVLLIAGPGKYSVDRSIGNHMENLL